MAIEEEKLRYKEKQQEKLKLQADVKSIRDKIMAEKK